MGQFLKGFSQVYYDLKASQTLMYDSGHSKKEIEIVEIKICRATTTTMSNNYHRYKELYRYQNHRQIDIIT